MSFLVEYLDIVTPAGVDISRPGPPQVVQVQLAAGEHLGVA